MDTNKEEYVSFGKARALLHKELEKIGAKILAGAVTEMIGSADDGVGMELTTAVKETLSRIADGKAGKLYSEYARAINVLYNAEIEANAHLYPPDAPELAHLAARATERQARGEIERD